MTAWSGSVAFSWVSLLEEVAEGVLTDVVQVLKVGERMKCGGVQVKKDERRAL